jgi:hypothetical protein
VIGALALAGWWLKTRSRNSTADDKNAAAISQSNSLFSWCFLYRHLAPAC